MTADATTLSANSRPNPKRRMLLSCSLASAGLTCWGWVVFGLFTGVFMAIGSCAVCCVFAWIAYRVFRRSHKAAAITYCVFVGIYILSYAMLEDPDLFR